MKTQAAKAKSAEFRQKEKVVSFTKARSGDKVPN